MTWRSFLLLKGADSNESAPFLVGWEQQELPLNVISLRPNRMFADCFDQ